MALAKALTKVAKDVPAFKFKAGIVQGRVLSIAEIQQLASLPSKEELISKVMFLLSAPAQRIATVLSGISRNLAVTVNEAVKADKFGRRPRLWANSISFEILRRGEKRQWRTMWKRFWSRSRA